MNNKVKNITPAKSIVRYIWVRMREEGATNLKDKIDVCVDVLNEAIENRYIQRHTGEYMIDKIKKMRSHQSLDWYLINSKNYFEKNFVTYE